MATLLPERWKEPLDRVHEKFDNFLERFFNESRTDERMLEPISAELPHKFMQFGRPVLELHEVNDELVVTAELPGLKKDDFSVEIVGKRLMIHGEKQFKHQGKHAGGGKIFESSYSSFTRSVQLPYEVDDSKVKADLKNGLLTLRIPKPKTVIQQRHRIKVS
jgi:HSP20 family protein